MMYFFPVCLTGYYNILRVAWLFILQCSEQTHFQHKVLCKLKNDEMQFIVSEKHKEGKNW